MERRHGLIALCTLVALGAACGSKADETNGGLTALSGDKERWDPTNDPLRLRGDYERTLASLPLSASLNQKPWSDTYWPNNRAGIAQRWRSPDVNPFTYQLVPKDKVRAMTLAELSTLSPAEKFDIYRGRYDYPTVTSERQRTHPNDESWAGLCHGWAPVAMHLKEPKPVLLEGKGGVKVPFAASDIKALLTYYQGNIAKPLARYLGARCRTDLATYPDMATNPECRDTNAGAFHVVVANQLGLRKEPFIADVSRDRQVWNQPVHAFQSRIIRYQAASVMAAPGTVKEAVIQTSIWYANAIEPQWQSVLLTEYQVNVKRTYNYRVELNAAGQIIGGAWLDADRPDFLWLQPPAKFTGEYAVLGKIHEASLTGPALEDPGVVPFDAARNQTSSPAETAPTIDPAHEKESDPAPPIGEDPNGM